MTILAPNDSRAERRSRPTSGSGRFRAIPDPAARDTAAGDPPTHLLLDAVTVAGFVQLCTQLAADHSPGGVALVALLALPFFTGWLAIARLPQHDASDRLVHRLLLVGAAFGTALMALRLPALFRGQGTGFVLGAILVRGVHLAVLHRANSADGAAGPWLRHLGHGVVGSIGCFALSLVVSGPTQWWIWTVAFTAETVWPLLRLRLARIADAADVGMAPRAARFITVLWGGLLMGAITPLAGTSWATEPALVAVCGSLLMAACWWLYVDPPTALDPAGLTVRQARRTATVGLMHLPLVVATVSLVAALRVLIDSAATGTGDTPARVLLAAATAVILMSLVFVQRELRDGVRDMVERMRFVAALVLLLAAVIAVAARAELSVLLVTAVVLALAVWETAEHRVVRRTYVAVDDPLVRPMLTPVEVVVPEVVPDVAPPAATREATAPVVAPLELPAQVLSVQAVAADGAAPPAVPGEAMPSDIAPTPADAPGTRPRTPRRRKTRKRG